MLGIQKTLISAKGLYVFKFCLLFSLLQKHPEYVLSTTCARVSKVQPGLSGVKTG